MKLPWKKQSKNPETEYRKADDGCAALEEHHSVLSFVSTVILALAVALCLAISIQVATNGYVSILGYSCFRVITGSMEPTIPVGAVLISEKTDIYAIQEDDIVCYRTEAEEIKGSIVTHRVVQVGYDSNGEYALITQGDANLTADPYLVHADNLVGRVIWFSGKENTLTELLGLLSAKTGFLAVVVFPILLIAGLVMQGCVRRLYRDMRELNEALREDQRKNALLPGYTTITQREFDEMYERIKAEILEALRERDAVPPTEAAEQKIDET
jgi:signal peptidase